MAWTAPKTWNVAEVATAANMNLHIRDNLNYLKGNTGTVAIANSMTVAGTLIATAGGASTDVLEALSGNSANYAGFSVGRAASEARFAIPASAGQFAAGAVAGDCIIRVDDTAKKVLIGAGGTETLTVRVNTSNQPITAVGVGGGMIYLSANAVNTSTSTVAAAGTVVKGAVFVVSDIDNTTGVCNSQLLDIEVGSGNTYVHPSGDSMRLDITAGGAITIKTSGGAHTHQWNALCLYS